MSNDLLNQIIHNQETAASERRDQGQVITEIRTVLLGTANPPTPGLAQNFSAFKQKTGSRLNRLEKGALLTFLGLGGGTGTVTYWENIKHIIGL